MTLKTVKMASTKYYDNLPTSGNEHGRAFRCLETEKKVLEMTRKWVERNSAESIFVTMFV